MFNRIRILEFAVASLGLLSGGCFTGDDAMQGTWRSHGDVGGYYNTIHFDTTLLGEARVYFYFDDDLYYADYETTVIDIIKPSSVYRIDMHCVPDGTCWSFDFTLTCHILSPDAMDCTGDSGFSEYDGFGFRRIE